MITPSKDAPPPELRIVPIENIFAHEEHDAQRSKPLIETLKEAEYLTNPPIVAPMGDDNYVVMDGANRTYSFRSLGYKCLLVQVAPYDSGYVNLGVWQHIISEWDEAEFHQALNNIPDVTVAGGWDYTSVAQVLLHDGAVLSVHGSNKTIEERNKTLRKVVDVYRNTAKLNRTAITDPTIIWRLYPEAIALVLFPPYNAEDIIAAAEHQAFLPPGVSRHIIQGRALKLNYPLHYLQDTETSLEDKNRHLQDWIREKLANRSVRYYAESTYQFDE
ncbi:MAG: hypothetical protein Phog2KO_01600 [Phototrophicaceae bacterium]